MGELSTWEIFLTRYYAFNTVNNFKNFKLVFLRNFFLEYSDFEMLCIGQENRLAIYNKFDWIRRFFSYNDQPKSQFRHILP